VRLMRESAPVMWLSDGRLVLWKDYGTTAVSVSTGRANRLSQTFAEPSPDGRQLAVLLGHHLYVVTAGDRAARRLELDWPSCAGQSGRCRVGTDRADRIAGSASRDVLFPGAGADIVRAGAGHDRVDAAFGADTVDGGAGNDVLYGEPGNDRLFGGPGTDSLIGHGGRDLLDGGEGRDFLYAADDAGARDTIRCGRGRDTVTADRADVVAADCERVNRSG
jgi:RTX calcium-binding nonapeptide repeat (4 copies)